MNYDKCKFRKPATNELRKKTQFFFELIEDEGVDTI